MLKKSVLINLFLLCSLNGFAGINELNQFEPSKYYKKDSDGDGIIDIYDNSPLSYDITDRDLRFLQELTYRTKDEIIKIFTNNNETIEWFNKDKLKSAADIREIVNNYVYVQNLEAENGFQANIFKLKNSNKAVLAIAGTNGANDTLYSDIPLAVGGKTAQGHNAEEAVKLLQNYSEYYITGHSLGGYLTLYAGATSAYDDPKFVHGAVFNSPGLNTNWDFGIWTRSDDNILRKTYIENFDKRFPSKTLYKIQAYGIHGDAIAGVKQIPTTKWNNQVNSGSAHSSTNFVATKPDKNFREWFSVGYRMDNPYLTLDTDNDGILDVDELKIGTDYTKADSDGDGFWDKLELAYGTDPMDSSSKPKLNEFYKTLISGYLTVNNPEEITKEKLDSKIFVLLKNEFKPYEKYLPAINYKVVLYDNLPSDYSLIKDYQYNLMYRVRLADGSLLGPNHLGIFINKNTENKGKQEIELYPLIIPEKIGVYDKNILSKLEKEAIKKKILEVNQKIPKKLEITFNENSDVSVKYEDGSTKTILKNDIIYQLPMNETFKLRPFSKIPVINLEKLSVEEKSEIIENIKKTNDTTRIENIMVSDTGDVSINFIDKTVYIINKEEVIYKSIKDIKDLIIKAKTIANEVEEYIANNKIITPTIYKMLNEKINNYELLKKEIDYKLNLVPQDTFELDVVKKQRESLITTLSTVEINDYNENNIIDTDDIKVGYEKIKEILEKKISYEKLIKENQLIDPIVEKEINNVVDEFLTLKETTNLYIDNLGNIHNIEELKAEFLKISNISKVIANDKNSNGILDETDYQMTINLIDDIKNKYLNVEQEKLRLKNQEIISINDKSEFDKLVQSYQNEKQTLYRKIAALGNIDKIDDLKGKYDLLLDVVNDIEINDVNNNGISDLKEIEIAENKILLATKAHENALIKKDELSKQSTISKKDQEELDNLIKEFKSKKTEAKIYVENLGDIKEKINLYDKIIKLQDIDGYEANDVNNNGINDDDEIDSYKIKLIRLIDYKKSIESEIQKLIDKDVISKKEVDVVENDIKTYEETKKDLKDNIKSVDMLPRYSELETLLQELTYISHVLYNDSDSNGLKDYDELEKAKKYLKNLDTNINLYNELKSNIKNNIITEELKEKINNIVLNYEKEKQIATDYINSLTILGKEILSNELLKYPELEKVVVNDRNNNDINDQEEYEKIQKGLSELKELEKIILSFNNNIISPELRDNINKKIEDYTLKKNEIKQLILIYPNNSELLSEFNMLKDFTNVIENDIDGNSKIDSEEIYEVSKNIQEALKLLEKINEEIKNYKNTSIDSSSMASDDRIYMDKLASEYELLRQKAIVSYNNLSDLIESKKELQKEIDKLIEINLDELMKVDKTKLREKINEAIIESISNNYMMADNEIKEKFDKILTKAYELLEEEYPLQIHVDEVLFELDEIIKQLNGNLYDSLKYVKLLHYNDTSIAKMLTNEGIFVNTYLQKSILTYLFDVINDKFKIDEVVGGVQLGYTKKVLDNLNVSVFTEYTNLISHNISLGTALSNNNFVFFTRYRLNMLPKDNIYAHNLDFFIKGGHYFDIKNMFKIEPSLSLYASYMPKTKLPNNVYMDHKFLGQFDVSLNMMYLYNGLKIYATPSVKYVYDIPILIDKNGNKLVQDNNNYFDYVISLGLEQQINLMKLGLDFTFNGNKNRKNYRFNLYTNFNW